MGLMLHQKPSPRFLAMLLNVSPRRTVYGRTRMAAVVTWRKDCLDAPTLP